MIGKWLFLAGGLFAAGSAVAEVPTRPLPEAVREAAPELELVGKARLTRFFFHVYDAQLWAPGGTFRRDGVYALDLVYGRSFEAEDLAARSVEEMAAIGDTTRAQREAWEPVMRRAFPDVKDGDRLIGLYTEDGESRFYFNGELYATVEDPAFGRAFFGIWLDRRTSEPEMRRALIGDAAGSEG